MVISANKMFSVFHKFQQNPNLFMWSLRLSYFYNTWIFFRLYGIIGAFSQVISMSKHSVTKLYHFSQCEIVLLPMKSMSIYNFFICQTCSQKSIRGCATEQWQYFENNYTLPQKKHNFNFRIFFTVTLDQGQWPRVMSTEGNGCAGTVRNFGIVLVLRINSDLLKATSEMFPVR